MCFPGSFGTAAPALAPCDTFRSHIPRPEALGRSESSESSSNKSSHPPSHNDSRRSRRSASSSSSDDDDLFANVISAGMPKSRSEPLNLKGKSLSTAQQSQDQGKGGATGGKTSSNGAGVVVRRRQTKDTAGKRRAKSKSPRNSKIIPGVCMTELKLVSKSSKESTPTKDDSDTPSRKKSPPTNLPVFKLGRENALRGDNSDSIAATDIWRDDETPNVAEARLPQESKLTQSPLRKQLFAQEEDLSQTLTASRVLELEANRVSDVVKAEVLTSSVCSTLSSIQPPSIMDSLISMTNENSRSGGSPSRSQLDKKLECRHTLSAKKGHAVPEMVRRALGSSSSNGNCNGGSSEDLSSLSSCQSNLDNIRPPTLMMDMDGGAVMDASIISIASLHSEIAEAAVDVAARAAAAAAAVAVTSPLANSTGEGMSMESDPSSTQPSSEDPSTVVKAEQYQESR